MTRKGPVAALTQIDEFNCVYNFNVANGAVGLRCNPAWQGQQHEEDVFHGAYFKR